MKETIYDKIQYSADFFSKLVWISIINAGGHVIPNFLEQNLTPEMIITKDYSWSDFDTLRVMYDIDLFVRENSSTYAKYLKAFYSQYECAKEYIMNYINTYPSDSIHLSKYADYAEQIMNHIQDILQSKEFNNDQPCKPKGQSRLSRDTLILLFFECRELRIIPQATNQVIAQVIEMLTGHSRKQIQDIIKSPGTNAKLLGKDNMGLKKENYKELISVLEELTEKVKKDYAQNLYDNELR